MFTQYRVIDGPGLSAAGGEAAFTARTEASYRRALDHFEILLGAG